MKSLHFVLIVTFSIVISNLRHEDEKSAPANGDFSSCVVEMTQNNKSVINAKSTQEKFGDGKITQVGLVVNDIEKASGMTLENLRYEHMTALDALNISC